MPNCFSDASVLVLLTNAIFAACFSLLLSSLPLTMLDETTDSKNSFYNCFWIAPPPLTALLTKWLKAGSGEGGRRHCTKSIAWARRWAAAGAGREPVAGKKQPGQGPWHKESSWEHLLVEWEGYQQPLESSSAEEPPPENGHYHQLHQA